MVKYFKKSLWLIYLKMQQITEIGSKKCLVYVKLFDFIKIHIPINNLK